MTPLVKTIKRVVHVSFGLHVGGQEKLLVEFARHVDRNDSTCAFISIGSRGTCDRRRPCPGRRVAATVNRSSAQSLVYDRRRRPSALWLNHGRLRRAISLLRRRSFTVS